MEKPLGYHLILDLYECERNLLVSGENDLGRFMIALFEKIKEAGMTPIRRSHHIFGNGSWSACILLAESHVSIHTWPDEKYVSADVFVCNYSKDNTHGAENLGTYLKDFFLSREQETNTVLRGERLDGPRYHPINDS